MKVFLNQLKAILNEDFIHLGKLSISFSQILLIIFLVIATKVLMRIIKRIVLRRFPQHSDSQGRAYFIFQVFSYLIWFFVLIVILDSLHISITYLVGASAALFVGIGLGMQDIFKDTISGLFMLVESNVRVNDVMEVDKIVGRVQRIGLRTSTLKSRDGISIIIPNHKFITENVVNWTNESVATRFRIEVFVDYASDVNLVKSLLLQSVENNSRIVQDIDGYKPSVRFENFGENGFEFLLFFWTQHTFPVENIKSEVRFKIVALFQQHRITIPYPHRVIRTVNELPDLSKGEDDYV